AYDLVLIDPGRSPIALIRELRELTGMSLREVKYLMDTSPQILKQSMPAAEAKALRLRLETAGARVELRPISPRRPGVN
ncbi:MAG: ribosomal protein L7/L12, partial [Polyangia bacterium]